MVGRLDSEVLPSELGSTQGGQFFTTLRMVIHKVYMQKEGTEFIEVLHLYKVCLCLHFSLVGLRILVGYFSALIVLQLLSSGYCLYLISSIHFYSLVRIIDTLNKT